MKKLVSTLFIVSLCVTSVFAANEASVSGTTPEPVKVEKAAQVKTIKSKATKKNKKINKAAEIKKAEKKEDVKEVTSK